MNLLKHTVTKLLDEPQEHSFINDNGEKVTYYLIPVECDCWGNISETFVTAWTLEDAKKITIGYEWES
ncbi:hypothetical protein ID856_14345 [Xenorhabdus sp. 18]|uniref:hypothetical protein n=1 Tax=Xenorhabdus doucetiae TaxID=351671 RepID=UPI0019B3A393|nr:hypothetical protein [Xenorhabdus sp. 18]MBD2797705.1 hypothetical protein [Xenorhabdus sp. 18]